MNTSSSFDKRVQASVPADLKERIRDLVENQIFESEAELIRTALWQFMDGDVLQNLPDEDDDALRLSHVETLNTELHRDLKERMDLLAWLMTVGLLLMATIASRILETLTRQKIAPMQLIDQALQDSVHERDIARRKLAAGWRAFRQVGREQSSNNGETRTL